MGANLSRLRREARNRERLSLPTPRFLPGSKCGRIGEQPKTWQSSASCVVQKIQGARNGSRLFRKVSLHPGESVCDASRPAHPSGFHRGIVQAVDKTRALCDRIPSRARSGSRWVRRAMPCAILKIARLNTPSRPLPIAISETRPVASSLHRSCSSGNAGRRSSPPLSGSAQSRYESKVHAPRVLAGRDLSLCQRRCTTR